MLAAVLAVLSHMNCRARCRDQPKWCMPVSTTSRQARRASKESMPSRAVSDMYRPISSASRSLVEAPALDVRAHFGVEEPPVVEQPGECLHGGDLQVMSWRAWKASASYS